MPKGPDLIAERTFFVSGKGNGGPAVVFRLWRPYQPKADYPRCRYELITSKGSKSDQKRVIVALIEAPKRAIS